QPKPLLNVGNKTILDSIVEKMVAVDELDEIFIVTNDKFHEHFENWVGQANYVIKLTVINDGTLSNEDRLGALGDIQHVINTAHVQEDLMIVAGDNLFGFSLVDLVTFYKNHDGNAISIYKEADSVQLIRGGTADIDNEGVSLVLRKSQKLLVIHMQYQLFILFKKMIYIFLAHIKKKAT